MGEVYGLMDCCGNCQSTVGCWSAVAFLEEEGATPSTTKFSNSWELLENAKQPSDETCAASWRPFFVPIIVAAVAAVGLCCCCCCCF